VLYSPLQPLRRLLVLGAGLDALPVVNMASELGWRVTIADHRPAYLEKGIFALAEQTALIDPERMSEALIPSSFDAVVVMSHHLLTDQIYLKQLADAELSYLGVLGPVARKNRLLDSLGSTGDSLRDQLRGPVGIDIGADEPESIALSLLAEIHATLAGKLD
jgi:xanthine/CO dehydrogenase XdhC/CoxF family maturation factor